MRSSLTIGALAAFLIVLSPVRCGAEAAWMWHEGQEWMNREYFRPLTTGREDPVTLQVKIGWPAWIDHACIYVTFDGSGPLGAFGVAEAGTLAVPMSWYGTVPDPDPEHDADMWIGQIPAREVGTTVRYRISSWHSGGGAERFANNHSETAVGADEFTYVIRDPRQMVAGETLPIDAVVTVPGVTPGDGPGPGLEVELVTDLAGGQARPMAYVQEVEDGELWRTDLTPAEPGIVHHQVRYRVDSDPWTYHGAEGDPAEMGLLVVDPAWIRDAVLYQVFPRVHGATDANGDGVLDNGEFGGFAGMLSDLPRIAGLGVGALWLMPSHPLSTDPALIKSTDGGPGSPYAPLDYLAINPDYGDAADLQELVDAAHDLGLKVMLGFVPNHLSPDNVLLGDHRDWFEGDPGDLFPDDPDWTDTVALNYDCLDPGDPVECNSDWPALWEYMREALAYWMEEFGIDGYRVDMASFEPIPFWDEQVPLLRERIPGMFLLGEAYHVQGPLEAAGFGSVYESALYRFLHDRLRPGQAQAAELWDVLAAQAAEEIPGRLPMRYVENHDETRAAAEFGLEGARSLAAFLMSSRCVPMLYSGQEYGATARIPLFRGIHGLEEYPAPEPSSDPELTGWYRALIAARNGSEALRRGTETVLPSTSTHVIAYLRSVPGEHVLALVNLDLSGGLPHSTLVALPREELGLPEGWTIELTDLITGGVSRVLEEDLDLVSRSLPAHGSEILRLEAACEYGGDLDGSGMVDDGDAELALLADVGRIELAVEEDCRADLDLDAAATHRDAVLMRSPGPGSVGSPVLSLPETVIPHDGAVTVDLVISGGSGIRGGRAEITLGSPFAQVLWLGPSAAEPDLWVSDRSTVPTGHDPVPPASGETSLAWVTATDPSDPWTVARISIGVVDVPPGGTIDLSLAAELCDADGQAVMAQMVSGRLTVGSEGPYGVRLELPIFVTPGQTFSVTGLLDNPGLPRSAVPTFFVLAVADQYWFWPSWVRYHPPESEQVDFRYEDVPTGTRSIPVIPAFPWPDTGPETATGLWFYGALLTPDGTALDGVLAAAEWGYGPG